MSVRATLRRLEAEMDGLKEVDEAPGLKKRVARLRTELEFLLESSANNMVYWLERRISPALPTSRPLTGRSGASARSRGQPSCRPPPSMSPNYCRSWSSRPFPQWCSPLPTLTVQGRIRAHAQTDGVERGARVGRAFALSLWRAGAALPAPGYARPPATPEFPEAAARTIQRVLEITRGRAFCLFTSYSQMRDLYERLLPGARLSHPAARYRAPQGAA